MAEQIALTFSDQEMIVQHAQAILEETRGLEASLSAAISAYRELASQGSFKEIYLGSGWNGNLGNGFNHFILKSQDLSILVESLYFHVEQTYSKMIDMDKQLAVRIANAALNDPETNPVFRNFIKTHPNEALAYIKDNYRGVWDQKEVRP